MNERIKVKAMCLIEHEGKFLVADSQTLSSKDGGKSNNPELFYRLLGGSLDFFESSEEGIRREIREELGSELEDLQLIDVIENRFVYQGENGHEIVFLYKAKLADKSLLEKETIHIDEEFYEFDAKWIPIDDLLNSKIPIYPPANYRKYAYSSN